MLLSVGCVSVLVALTFVGRALLLPQPPMPAIGVCIQLEVLIGVSEIFSKDCERRLVNWRLPVRKLLLCFGSPPLPRFPACFLPVHVRLCFGDSTCPTPSSLGGVAAPLSTCYWIVLICTLSKIVPVHHAIVLRYTLPMPVPNLWYLGAD